LTTRANLQAIIHIGKRLHWDKPMSRSYKYKIVTGYMYIGYNGY